MKTRIFYWASNYKLKDVTGYEHNQDISDKDVFEVAREIFLLGLNAY